ncbi:uncharacterized protein LOC130754189 isoform X2 [Actinidia eriantha]|nr:uncharacterized protein LOC130754189 isoform X2 [Actinidia eriantha]
MDSEIEIVEPRLNSFLGQLQVEFVILDRLVYKNKNQHRHCSYFQYLLKVRRDLRLLQSAHLEEIFSSCFLVIHGTRPKQKVQLLESLKKRKCHSGKHNFLERLLGAARLLSQMVEPMLKAATEISTLLARSFFMGFSLTVLALLARLRVLVQQILLDAVTVFNMVSSLSQKEQSVKLTQEGFEVFREYYPMNERAVLLDCVWETDKFVLHESFSRSEPEREDRDIREVSVGASSIQYQSIEVLLGDDEFGKTDPNHTIEGLPHVKLDNASSFEDLVIENDDGKKVEDSSNVEEGLGVASENLCSDIGFITDLNSSSCSDPLKLKSRSGRKVAFVSVNNPAASTTNLTGFHVKGIKRQRDEREDPFFDLLSGGNPKDSLF